MSRLTLTPLGLAGLHVVQRQRLSDSRGDLSRIFCAHELVAAGWTQPLAQINHTRTARRGTVRGLHFQHVPHAEAKLVSCIRGEVWDVAVDLRRGSATLKRPSEWPNPRACREQTQHFIGPPDHCAHAGLPGMGVVAAEVGIAEGVGAAHWFAAIGAGIAAPAISD